MESLQAWAFSVCSSMVACGLAQMILPKGSMQKIFQVTVSVFFLCCLLSPIVLRAPELRVEAQTYTQEEIERRAEKTQEVARMQSQRVVQKEIRQIIAEKLADMGINARDITINISSDERQKEEIWEVTLLLSKTDETKHRKIVQELEKALGVAVHVRYTGEEG